jgi:hypothetical protein
MPQQWTRVAFYSAALAWLNLYICRDLFSIPMAHMNSMHGFWIALARRSDGSWFHPSWWPYWDNGMPFELTYAPLVPALIRIWSSMFGAPEMIAFQTLTALVYTLIPIVLFFAAWRLTGAPGYSFAAGVVYSLTSPTQLLIPDGNFRWSGFWDSRRLFLATCWDETPHLLALACLPLIVLFLARAIETRRRRDFVAAALLIAIATYASPFAPVVTTMAAICLLATLHTATLRTNALRTNVAMVIAIGIAGYAASAAFLSPSVIAAIHADASDRWHEQTGWTLGSLTALAIVIFGFTLLWHCLPRWMPDWRLRFFALFAWITGSVAMIWMFLHRQFLPQPTRYKLELEMALALLIVFGVRSWFEKMPVPLKRAAVFLLLALAAEQVVKYRHDEKADVARADSTATVEYRVATWVERNLPGVRVMLPGSVAQWANAFVDVQQFSGSSWSMAYNRVQQRALFAIYSGADTPERDARLSLAWLKAFGVGAVGISNANSQEYWKGFGHPDKFDGVLPMLWSDSGVTIYRIPRRSDSLAHVIPENALAQKVDLVNLEKYDAALDDVSLPLAASEWDGRNRIRIHASAFPGHAISLSVSYHPGWHAFANGRRTAIFADGLGLMWMRPACNGACEIQLDYDGGLELNFCRFLSAAAILALFATLLWPERRA